MPTVPRKRLDHLLRQGYSEGFTNRQGKLSVLDTAKQRWFETLPKSVAAVRGFYDYSEGAQPDRTADEALQEFEDNFPALRREIVSNCWRPPFRQSPLMPQIYLTGPIQ
jgi:hypothetical protein